jgi:OmpA-OmpF porin, OOP family
MVSRIECPACSSKNQRKLNGELALHFQGLPGLGKEGTLEFGDKSDSTEFHRKKAAMERKTIVVILMTVLFVTSVAAFGAGDKAKVKGMIISRTGETLIVNSPDGKITVVLTDETRTKDDVGLFGLDKTELSNVVLIPGLKVSVDGVSDDQGRVAAKTITVDGDDLETAELIQAGLHPTAEQVAANVQTLAEHREKIETNKVQLAAQKQYIETNQQNIAANKQQIEQNIKDIQENTDRFMALSEYDVKGQANVKFNFGSANISAKDQTALKELANMATGLKGYIVEVIGYADSTGNAAINTKLSEDRAQAVITYLVQQGSVPVRHIVAPGAMGEYGAAAPNETKEGRAENRRVEVKILVNKGIVGG